jgi:drug/metabolite transporter (DMT)-like permease
MLYLLGSIVLTSYLTLSFKAIAKFGISSFQAIVFNYITCVITGAVVNGTLPVAGSTFSEPWFPWALIMGTTFITLFNLIAYITRKIGVSVATVANKLSLVIPFAFSIALYGEQLRLVHIAGILIALTAVVFTCYRDTSTKTEHHAGLKRNTVLVYLLPFILFIGSGLLDTMIKYVEQAFINDSNHNSYLIGVFTVAALLGTLALSFAVLSGKERIDPKAIVAGVAIGIPNYFSIWCLVRVLRLSQGNSAAIIPVNNMGVVLLSAVAASVLFGERLSRLNQIGILLSIFSIALIAFG